MKRILSLMAVLLSTFIFAQTNVSGTVVTGDVGKVVIVVDKVVVSVDKVVVGKVVGGKVIGGKVVGGKVVGFEYRSHALAIYQ